MRRRGLGGGHKAGKVRRGAQHTRHGGHKAGKVKRGAQHTRHKVGGKEEGFRRGAQSRGWGVRRLLTHSLSSSQCPMFKREGDEAEPYAEMAKFFTESRLLQRDIKLLLEGVSNQLVLATVIHPVS